MHRRALLSFALLMALLPAAAAQPVMLRYGQIPSTVHGIASLP